MGPSGSGKSTLLNLISLIDRPTSGSIKFLDKSIDFDLKEENDIFRANNIGIIYQQDNLLNDFTALENVYFACLASGLEKNLSIIKAKKYFKKKLVLVIELIIIQMSFQEVKNREFPFQEL